MRVDRNVLGTVWPGAVLPRLGEALEPSDLVRG
jgi:hypothetical protein